MQEEKLPIESEVQPKKRGRKPKTEKLETSDTTTEEKTAKKRGRKPKTKVESAVAEVTTLNDSNDNLDIQAKPEKKKRGRQPRTDGPQWRDTPEPSQIETESDAEEQALFVPSTSDDFAYATHQQDNENEIVGDTEIDDEIPTSYSTTDDDLIQDNYQNSWSAEDEDDDENEIVDSEQNTEEVVEIDLTENDNYKQNRQQNQQSQQNRNQQNNRQNKWRNKDNRFNKNQQNRNQQNNRFNNKNSNNNIQNRNQQNQQNQQNRNQQNNKRQNPQNQKNKQNKPKWLQQTNESDFINPTELFDWEVLKSADGIEKYLAEIYFGKIQPQEESQSIVEQEQTPQQTDSVEHSETIEETTNTQDSTKEVEKQIEVVEEIQPEQVETKSLSYWEMLEQSNKDMFDKSNDTHIPEEVPALQQSKTEEKQEIKVESQSVFTEDYTFTVANCGEISCLENFNEIYPKSLKEIQETLVEMGMENRLGLNKNALIKEFYNLAFAQKKLVKISGILDVFENNYGGAIVFDCDNYRLRKYCVYIPKIFIDKYSLARGHKLTVLAAPPKSEDSCPFAVKICSVMDDNPDEIKNVVAFNDLVPYYPTERIIMENANNNAHSNISMRAVDLLAPIGLGQRALIVAPPRTGKTVLMQSMAQSIRKNKPNAHLIVLLVDERPEEVTDFKRSVDAEVIASTFDEEAQNHVHAAEMVISYARRMVEAGKDVIILLDSITRLARAYNALMPNGGRTMSGGVEANALQKPKKFFGSARNIEGGGSLTIIGTALVETGSKMDEVIFEEFKGTGNLELHLDRMLSDKRIFPAINMEKTGTRKEELLYHPDELDKIYALRKAMHGVPIVDSMEMLLKRLKNTKTNVEFLLGLNR